MAANLTRYGAQALLDYSLTATAAVRPTAWFVGLNTVSATATGTVGELGAGIGYTRQAIAFAGANLLTQATANTGIVTFGPASGAGFGTVAYGVLWDAVSDGNPWWYFPLTAQVVVAGDSYTIPVGFVTVTFPPLMNP